MTEMNTLDNNGNTLLSIAAENGNKKRVQLLIDNKADLNLGFPLHSALALNQPEIAKLLINAGADVNRGQPIRNVVELEYIEYMEEITKLLIENGADIDAFDSSDSEEGRAALHDAVSYCEIEFAELLLKYGANVNVRDKEGWTPLHYSVYCHGDDDYDSDDVMRIVKLLIDAGLNANAKNNEDNTALHIAASKNDMPFATYLVREAGADVTIRDSNGNLFYELARNEEVWHSLLMLYNEYESQCLSKQFGREQYS